MHKIWGYISLGYMSTPLEILKAVQTWTDPKTFIFFSFEFEKQIIWHERKTISMFFLLWLLWWQMNWSRLVRTEDERRIRLESLVPYHLVQSAGSAAVSKLKLTGSPVATFTAEWKQSQAWLSLEDYTLCPPPLWGEFWWSQRTSSPRNKNLIMDWWIWGCFPWQATGIVIFSKTFTNYFPQQFGPWKCTYGRDRNTFTHFLRNILPPW